MIKKIRVAMADGLTFVEGLFDYPFGPVWNPMRQLGTLSFFFYWVVAVSGLYVYIMFDTSVTSAYPSVEAITHEQWYLAGVMRSLHRYGSDAMVVTTLLHMTREFVTDRYRGVRWFTWFTGVPILWFLYMSGISGYWLVWDDAAQYVAVASMEWLDALGIFGRSLANNFLTRGSLGDRFFTLLVFMHIFLPLFLLFMMWIHLIKINRPKINPPGGLALGCLIMLIVLSLANPATSHIEADLARVPTLLSLDWFYMVFYPAYDNYGGGMLWVISIGISLGVAFMPWLPPAKKPPAAEVILDKCNGCTRCFQDCPFGAVAMKPRTDGRPYREEAAVDPTYCTGCGMCVGACPMSTPFRRAEHLESAIEVPAFPLHRLRDITDAALDKLAAEKLEDDEPGLIVYGCEHGCSIGHLEERGTKTLDIPCVGMVPPSFIDYMLSRGQASGVVLVGCRDGDCFHRLGHRWTEDRIDGERDPYLRERVERDRIGTIWVAPMDSKRLGRELAAFRDKVRELGPVTPAKARRRPPKEKVATEKAAQATAANTTGADAPPPA